MRKAWPANTNLGSAVNHNPEGIRYIVELLEELGFLDEFIEHQTQSFQETHVPVLNTFIKCDKVHGQLVDAQHPIAVPYFDHANDKNPGFYDLEN